MIDKDLIEVLQMFLSETRGMIDEVESKLIQLQEQHQGTGQIDKETVNYIFRIFHSIKGAAAFLDLKNVSDVTHEAETLLDEIRQGKLSLSNTHTQVLLKVIDFVRTAIAKIETHHSDSEIISDAKAIIDEIKAQIETKPVDPVALVKPPSVNLVTNEIKSRFVQEADELIENVEQVLLEAEKNNFCAPDRISEAFRAIHSIKGNSGFMGLVDLERLGHKTEEILEVIKNAPERFTPDIIRALLGVLDALRGAIADLSKGGSGAIQNCDLYVELLDGQIKPKIESAIGNTKEQKPVVMPKPPENATTVQREIRVNLEKLDHMINLVGELVIAEAMVTRCPSIANLEDENLDRSVHHLRRITSELQDVAMSVRMIPLATTFRKMTRLLHDLSNKTGKQVKLQLLGEDTEVDKTVIELINDPLVHIVRNSVDHGIEPPEERRALGKPESGTVTIKAKHDSGEVWIVISDDGRGLNRDRILAKAIQTGLVSGSGADLSDEKVFSLIFEPGFSTAEKVTDVSGRGVGMDVVKKNMEKVKGRIDLRSNPNNGTSVILRIPLTLAIIDGMLVRAGDNKYTIPMLSVRESFRPQPEQITIAPDGQEIVLVRKEVVPIIRLDQIFNIDIGRRDLSSGIIVIIDAENHVVGLFVDEIIGQQETVIKGLSGYLGHTTGVSGCTILGDGEVSLILDVGLIVRTLKKREVLKQNQGVEIIERSIEG